MSLKSFVNNHKEWEEFQELVNQKIEIATRTMVGTNDYEHILRYQGAIRELQKFKYLRDEVNGRDKTEV